MIKIGVLGSGAVGRTLAEGFEKLGFSVMLGTGHPAKLANWQSGVNGRVGSFEKAADFGDLIVLAVKGSAALSVTEQVKRSFSGKTILDATNPLSDEQPNVGFPAFFTNPETSLMELLQEAAPEAHFVKAFSTIKSDAMINTKRNSKQEMFICGNEASAKAEAKEILKLFGFKTKDAGDASEARVIELQAQL
ncbi:NADPH-dependent F420 reductase [Algoriphagus sp. AK58]|uniref:NADPH-dependent F420 reductase n=1 Tax=Algoriphagus sp. AK58 TaxID=1406877 RepID=UPI00164FCF3A|nr:NAD(P)-binding domain-containing protein [Algoriphagus sp. AK58]MBC6367182.1 DNA-binding protein [Algoriphagus sp. AK58]